MMPDFTSSLYLGLKHNSSGLPDWEQLTTGVPAALSEPGQHRNLGSYLAHMQGCDAGIIAPSTLHLYFDLFDLLSKQNITVFIDENIYPVSTYGIEKLIVKRIPIYRFKHQDAVHLQTLLSNKIKPLTIPVVLTDGFCPQCGRAVPIKKYDSILQSFGGKLIIDDTQAFGILGKRKDNFIYGYGGGGILQWLNVFSKNIITIVSLAKAFGVPMAVISGSRNFISVFDKNSKIRETSSPVSFAHVNAAYNAIAINKKTGDEKRKQLFKNVSLLKRELTGSGIQLFGGFFPVQSIANINPRQTNELYKILLDKGFITVLVNNHKDKIPAVCFILSCEHLKNEILSLTHIIKQALIKHRKYIGEGI